MRFYNFTTTLNMPSCYLKNNIRVPLGEMTDPNNRENQKEYVETRKRVEAARVKIEKNKIIVKKMKDKIKQIKEDRRIIDEIISETEDIQLLEKLEIMKKRLNEEYTKAFSRLSKIIM